MSRKIILLLSLAIITLAHLSAASSLPNKIESNYKIRRISPDGGLSINGQLSTTYTGSMDTPLNLIQKKSIRQFPSPH